MTREELKAAFMEELLDRGGHSVTIAAPDRIERGTSNAEI